MTTTRLKTMFGAIALVLGAVGACNGRVTTGGSETNWLDTCSKDGDCVVGHCVCGVCSEQCSNDNGCPGGTGPDSCAASGSIAYGRICASAASAPAGVCLKSCTASSGCSLGLECLNNVCAPTQSVSGAGGASGVSDGGTEAGTAGAAGSTTTEPPTREAGTSPPVPHFATSTTTELSLDSIPVGTIGNDVLTGKCLPRQLPVDSAGHAVCSVFSVSVDTGEGGTCRCDQPGYKALSATPLAAVRGRLRDQGTCDADGGVGVPCNQYCACELEQATGSELTSCLSVGNSDKATPAWCYVDPTANLGDPELVANCLMPRTGLRIMGPAEHEDLFLACVDSRQNTGLTSGVVGNLGDPCTPEDESNPAFSGYTEQEVSVETGSQSCNTGVCLVANFRGRTTCPYGQPAASTLDPMTGRAVVDPTVPAAFRCYLPNEPEKAANEVTVPVIPQLVARPPEKAVYCSCRCDGAPGTGPFCECPGGFECAPLVDDYGTSSALANVAGSYCIKAGTGVANPLPLAETAECDLTHPLPRPAGCGL